MERRGEVYCYIPGWWCRFGQDFESARSISESVRADLGWSGFVINESKSLWKPIQSLDWLGYSIDAVKFVLTIPARRFKKVRETGLDIISIINKHKTVHVRKVASFVGQVISISTLIGSFCQLMSRCILV